MPTSLAPRQVSSTYRSKPPTISKSANTPSLYMPRACGTRNYFIMEIKDFTIGVQHIGIPNNDIKKTIEFFQLLGFDIAFRTINGPKEVT